MDSFLTLSLLLGLDKIINYSLNVIKEGNNKTNKFNKASKTNCSVHAKYNKSAVIAVYIWISTPTQIFLRIMIFFNIESNNNILTQRKPTTASEVLSRRYLPFYIVCSTQSLYFLLTM
jgi:hypothetical protein